MATRTIVRFVFLAITLIAALPGTELAGGFQLPQELINFLFPKDSGVVRVRNLGRARALNNVEILNFVSVATDFPSFPLLDITSRCRSNTKIRSEGVYRSSSCVYVDRCRLHLSGRSNVDATTMKTDNIFILF